MASQPAPDTDSPCPCLHSPYPYDQVLEFVGEAEGRSALDVGAGTGALVSLLLKRGLNVTACDIEAGVFQVPGVELRPVNLNTEALPFPDESFDLLTCCDVVEHIENPHALVREFRRVLRPGGRAILTTPNILNVEARLKVMLAGVSAFHRDLGERFGPVAPGEGLGHVNPIPLQELLWLGRAYGLPVEAIGADYVPKGMRYLSPLAALIRLCGRFASARSRQRYHLDLANSQPVLFGYRLVLSMVKSESAPPTRTIPAKRKWT